MQMRLVREENDSLKHLQTKQENDARAKAEVIQQLKLGLGTVQAQLMALKDSETPELKQKLDGQLVTFWNECKFSLEELSRKGKEEIECGRDKTIRDIILHFTLESLIRDK